MKLTTAIRLFNREIETTEKNNHIQIALDDFIADYCDANEIEEDDLEEDDLAEQISNCLEYDLGILED